MAEQQEVDVPEELRSELYLSYDTERFKFREILEQIFDSTELDMLHSQDPASSVEGYVNFENDQATSFHKRFYSSPHFPAFLELYREFVAQVIAPLFVPLGETQIVYQTRPTFRVCLPNNVAVGRKHRDFDYNHPAGEINFWVPFTPAWGTNGLYVESEPDKGDFHPIQPMKYGQIFRFWGNKCWHYNEINRTEKTRVSFDTRVIPFSIFRPAEGVSVKSKMRFNIGEYYSLLAL